MISRERLMNIYSTIIKTNSMPYKSEFKEQITDEWIDDDDSGAIKLSEYCARFLLNEH